METMSPMMYLPKDQAEFLVSLLAGPREVTPFELDGIDRLTRHGLVSTTVARSHRTLRLRLEIVDAHEVRLTEAGRKEIVRIRESVPAL